MDAKAEPLLSPRRGRAPAWPCSWAVVALTLAYTLTGARERVCFARMAAVSPQSVVSLHTQLTALSTRLFAVLRLARSQRAKPTTSQTNSLQRLRPLELAQMAALDALQSILALTGAGSISGIMQALLIQATVPASCLLSTLLLHERQAYSQRAGGLLVAAAACFLLVAPSLSSLHWLAANVSPLEGRLVFTCSVVASALSSAYKRHALTRHPVDMLLLNSWLSAAQLVAAPQPLVRRDDLELERYCSVGEVGHCR